MEKVFLPDSQKTIVLVGLMGAGKSRVGAEIARLTGLPFMDSDREIERAAGMPVSDIFERFGEAEFRKGEEKVILRLLEAPRKILASGGGAFIQPAIREAVKKQAVSVWLKADLDILVERTSRSTHRPLLRDGDAREKLRVLMDYRYPLYAEADITVESDDRAPRDTAALVVKALEDYLQHREESTA